MADPLLLRTSCNATRPRGSPGLVRSLRAAVAGEQGFSLIDMLMVVALIGVIAGIAVPVTGGAFASQKFRNDGQALTNMVGLAKMRASAGCTPEPACAPTSPTGRSCSSAGTRRRVPGCREGRDALSPGVTFSFGTLATPPPNTQATIVFSPACRVGLTAASATIANTACIVFNSRGLPVDGAGVTFGGHAVYLTDGVSVAATTVTATPRIRRWSTSAHGATPQWKEQQ